MIADDVVGELKDGFECSQGAAYIGIKIWTSNADESADMIKVIGAQIGFEVTGKIEVFVAEPIEPPGNNPYGYDIQFTPYAR